jgi:uncharacterized protein YdaU (DUF1376 family)
MLLPLDALFYFMAKDPAFLFYVNDFDSGTKFFSDEQVGKYLRLLIAQFQHGALSEKQVLFICRELDEDILKKFQKDENGNYFNVRLADEIQKRSRFSESRSNNRKGKNKEEVKNISSSYVEPYVHHMENENENENEDVNKSKNIKNPFSQNFLQFWEQWKEYKRKQYKFTFKLKSSEQASLNHLFKLSNGSEMAAKSIIDQSIANGWKGFFELKTKQHEPANRDQARIDYWNHMVDTFGTDEEKATRKIV